MAMERSVRPLARCLQCRRHDLIILPYRSFSNTTAQQEQLEETESASSKAPLDSFNVTTPRLERKLMREQKKVPVGSRRRRAAMQSSPNIPFMELPYQCFQEARNFLHEDRNTKLEEIRVQRERMTKLQDKVAVGDAAQAKKDHALRSMRTRLERLKILADINDPLVKKKFEDNQADMNKPIYRHLADKQWRSYKRLLLMQRIQQMNVVPDVLPAIDPTVATTLSFTPPPGSSGRRRLVQHGELVDSRVSETAPSLNIQRFAKGEKLYTIAVINPDVPNVEKDAFDYRCHFLACNIPLSPTNTLVRLGELSPEGQVVLPWLPAYAQKGLPYQRMSILILEQPPSQHLPAGSGDVAPSRAIDTANLDARFGERDSFILRAFIDKLRLLPVGIDLFRTQWDDGTAGVMRRAGIIGDDVEFKRKRIEPLPYKRLKEERFR